MLGSVRIAEVLKGTCISLVGARCADLASSSIGRVLDGLSFIKQRSVKSKSVGRPRMNEQRKRSADTSFPGPLSIIHYPCSNQSINSSINQLTISAYFSQAGDVIGIDWADGWCFTRPQYGSTQYLEYDTVLPWGGTGHKHLR